MEIQVIRKALFISEDIVGYFLLLVVNQIITVRNARVMLMNYTIKLYLSYILYLQYLSWQSLVNKMLVSFRISLASYYHSKRIRKALRKPIWWFFFRLVRLIEFIILLFVLKLSLCLIFSFKSVNTIYDKNYLAFISLNLLFSIVCHFKPSA